MRSTKPNSLDSGKPRIAFGEACPATGRPRRRRLAVTAVALLLTASVGSALERDAAYFFHQGARHYLATNELAQARTNVQQGLTLYPDDLKLKKLWELLNQQQQQQSQNDQQKNDEQQKQDQQKSDQDKQQARDQQQQQPQPQEQPKPQEQRSQQPQQKDAGDQQQKKQQAGANQDDKQKDAAGTPRDQNAEAGQMMQLQMTPQQAQQLLDAQKDDERVMIFLPAMKTNRPNRVFKDW